MNAASNSRRPTLLCALLLLLCAFAAFPVAEAGMVDDWSYVQSARALAQTGHIVYNGWGAMILGWQLYLGALFIKLFGASFTAVRASTLCVALATTILTRRVFCRAGINSRNATIGTLTLVLSPLFLPLALSFMSDIGGLFCVVLCLYACLRALQAQTDHAVLAWLAFAALSNVLGGTVRQIVWLGSLVMFPCAVWLLRRRPHVVIAGALLYAVSFFTILATVHWVAQQPYMVREPLLGGNTTPHQLAHLALEMLSLFLSAALLLLPVLAAFTSKIPLRDPRVAATLACCALSWLAACVLVGLYRPGSLNFLIAPFKGNYLNAYGIAHTLPLKGIDPVVLTRTPRVLLTLAVLLALFSFCAFLFTNCRCPARAQTRQAQPPLIAFNKLLILVIPFVLAYLALLFPRGLRGALFDRYLLLLLPIALMLFLRLYQDHTESGLPWISSALVVLFAAYAVAGTHDDFSLCRAKQAAVNELRAAGVPDTAIDAGFEHNALTQVERFGYINDPKINLLARDKLRLPSSFPADCQPTWVWFTPAIVPGYALSYDPGACGGLSRFAHVSYREWLTARPVPIYVVDTVKEETPQR